MHDAHNHWQTYFDGAGKLPGALFNQTTLALDAALAGQGIAIACRAFVQADLDAGRLREVAPAGFEVGTDFYLVRKRMAQPRETVAALWDWCLANWTLR